MVQNALNKNDSNIQDMDYRNDEDESQFYTER